MVSATYVSVSPSIANLVRFPIIKFLKAQLSITLYYCIILGFKKRSRPTRQSSPTHVVNESIFSYFDLFTFTIGMYYDGKISWLKKI